MPFKDPEKQKEWERKYYEKNKEKIKEYYEKNKDKRKEYNRTSPVYYKYYIIRGWKRKGIIDDDFDSLIEVYKKETHCWICGKEYIKRDDRNLDHDHETGEVRYICCRRCNRHVVG